ncbi:MAG: bifunctional metallophosphatase/5-nucleotidase [Burkholderiaceae bacterium]|nr:bifunctional metallophosphatase/5-nucleotidase [Burkholderiaceae bacterium]
MLQPMRSFTRLLALAASVLLASCAGIEQVPSSPVTVSVVSFNDFHGNLQPPAMPVAVKDRQTGSVKQLSAGGVAHLATLVQQLKAQNPANTVVVGGGDLVSASPLVSGLFHDEPTIDALSLLGLEFSTLGNHEFDHGRDELLRLQNGGCFPKSADGTRGIVGVDTCMNDGKFEGAKFRYLAANVLDGQSGGTLFPPYAVKTIGGVKVGIIGLTLKEAASVVSPAGVAGMQFADEAATVNRLVPELRQQGVAAIVVLMHQGAATEARHINDPSCPGFSGEAIAIVDRFDPAVDVVVTGHTHEEYVCTRPDGKLMTQAGRYGRMATKIDLTIDPALRKVVRKAAQTHVAVNRERAMDENGQVVPLPAGYSVLQKDAAQEALVGRYASLVAKRTEVVVGTVSAPLSRKKNKAGESTLGNVVADAYLAATSTAAYGSKPAEIAFINPGGLRNGLAPENGQVTYGALYQVHPFGNYMVTMDLSGQQILRLLEQQWEQPQPQGGRMLAVSNGFSYAWDASQPEGAAPGKGKRVIADSVKLHGKPLEPNRIYRVTTVSFLASGGDNFRLFAEGKNRQNGGNDLDVLVDYFKSRQRVSPPVRNRIERRK